MMSTKINKINGFSLLELMVTIAILGIVAYIAVPSTTSWNVKKSFENAHQKVAQELYMARNEAISKSTTTRVNITQSDDDYTIIISYSATPTTNCNTSGVWTQISSYTLEIHEQLEITGTGISTDSCFYRDGTATSNNFNIRQKNGATDIGNITISITQSTGYIDVT